MAYGKIEPLIDEAVTPLHGKLEVHGDRLAQLALRMRMLEERIDGLALQLGAIRVAIEHGVKRTAKIEADVIAMGDAVVEIDRRQGRVSQWRLI